MTEILTAEAWLRLYLAEDPEALEQRVIADAVEALSRGC